MRLVKVERRTGGPVLALLLVCSGLVAAPQGSPSGAQTGATFRTEAAVVLLDLVVRDKKGRTIGDLQPSEVEVFEDGARCELLSFRFANSPDQGPAAAAPVEAAAPSLPAAPEATPGIVNLVTLVFDRLDLEGAKLAKEAGFQWLERGLTPQTRVAVFKIGQNLSLLQPYTADAGSLRQAVDRATSVGDVIPRSLTDDLLRAQERLRRLSDTGGPAGAMPGTPAPLSDASHKTEESLGSGRASVLDRKTAEVEVAALRMAESLERQQQGTLSLWPMLAVLQSQSELAGRKTLVFFSPGLQIPAGLEDLFRMTMAQANRSNVSIYAVDTRGLVVTRQLEQSGRAVQSAAMSNMSQLTRDAGEGMTKEEMQTFDQAGDALRLDTQGGLRDLAESTGGFLVANSNRLGVGMERIAADATSYYAVTYTSPQPKLDGGFRKITVRVARKDAVVQSRKGYFALPQGGGLVLPWEVPLLSALGSSVSAHDFDIRSGLLQFGRITAGRESLLVAEVPLAPLNFVRDTKQRRYRLDLSMLAVVKDASGRVVERASDRFPLEGPLDRLSEAQASTAVLRRAVTLPPGSYTLEVVARVREDGKVALLRTLLEVPDAGPLDLSSLVVIRRAEPAATSEADPLRVGDLRVVPNLDAPLSKAMVANLSFFVMFSPGAGPTSRLTLELKRDGRVMARVEPPLPARDPDGWIRCVVILPSGSLPTGRYEVRARASQAASDAEATTILNLAP